MSGGTDDGDPSHICMEMVRKYHLGLRRLIETQIEVSFFLIDCLPSYGFDTPSSLPQGSRPRSDKGAFFQHAKIGRDAEWRALSAGAWRTHIDPSVLRGASYQ